MESDVVDLFQRADQSIRAHSIRIGSKHCLMKSGKSGYRVGVGFRIEFLQNEDSFKAWSIFYLLIHWPLRLPGNQKSVLYWYIKSTMTLSIFQVNFINEYLIEYRHVKYNYIFHIFTIMRV